MNISLWCRNTCGADIQSCYQTAQACKNWCSLPETSFLGTTAREIHELNSQEMINNRNNTINNTNSSTQIR